MGKKGMLTYRDLFLGNTKHSEILSPFLRLYILPDTDWWELHTFSVPQEQWEDKSAPLMRQ